MVEDYEWKVQLIPCALALLVVIICFYPWPGTGEASNVVKSEEFVTTQAGAPRFQRYETNDSDFDVVVDAETGVAYLVTGDGTTALVERDGEPMTIAEVGDAD